LQKNTTRYGVLAEMERYTRCGRVLTARKEGLLWR
jgi:hypothetical protein